MAKNQNESSQWAIVRKWAKVITDWLFNETILTPVNTRENGLWNWALQIARNPCPCPSSRSKHPVWKKRKIMRRTSWLHLRFFVSRPSAWDASFGHGHEFRAICSAQFHKPLAWVSLNNQTFLTLAHLFYFLTIAHCELSFWLFPWCNSSLWLLIKHTHTHI